MSLEGRVLNNRFLIDKAISKGGMGEVYLGHHTLIGKRVAVKVLSPEWVSRDDIVARFYQEAQAASLIGHSSIVDVLDMGLIDESVPYLVMEYLEGQSLGRMLEKEGAIDLAAACGVLAPVLLGLGAAHEKGIIHRDLKPDNIFLALGNDRKSVTIKIIDFGVSKFSNIFSHLHLTVAGAPIGTPAYMSPEQARGAVVVDHRSDLFAAGVMLYEMLVGTIPFNGETSEEVLAKIMTDDPTPPWTINPHFPQEAKPIIDKALSKSVEERYTSAAEMLADLQKLDQYALREQSLARYIARFTNFSFIGSNESISRNQPPSGLGVPNALSLFTPPSNDISPSSDVSSEMPTGYFVDPKKAARKGRIIFASAVAIIITAVFIAVFLLTDLFESSRQEQAQGEEAGLNADPASALITQPPLPDAQNTVTIELRGVPKDAAIQVDDKQMLSPLFTALRTKTPITLKIDAKGYEPYESVLVPLNDRLIDVRLRPTARNATGASPTGETAALPHESPRKPTGSTRPQKEKSAVKKNPQPKYIQGRFGAEIAETFE